MSFNPEKCTVLKITTSKRYRRETNYFLYGRSLQVTDSVKYLDVALSDDLQLENHPQATIAKDALTLHSLLKCNFWDCSKPVSAATYNSMVRPTVKYASHLGIQTEDVNCLDKDQRRTASYGCDNYTERTQKCVTAMASSLGFKSLQGCRSNHAFDD